MRNSELYRSRKAVAGLIGFLARGPAACAPPAADAPPNELELLRAGGARRRIDARLLKGALARGLITEDQSQSGPAEAGSDRAGPVYRLTPEGRAALKRCLADPQRAFQDQHRSLASRTGPDHQRLLVNEAESPLTALARLKGRHGGRFLEASHVEAGERLRIDFTRGHMQPSLGQSWEPVRTARQSGQADGSTGLSAAALSARLRVESALAEVGPELSGVLIDVCCYLKGLSVVERERQWPARSAKLMLRTALSALARHYAHPEPRVSRQPAPPRRAP